MAAKTTISLEEFLKLPEAGDDGTHYELDEGAGRVRRGLRARGDSLHRADAPSRSGSSG